MKYPAMRKELLEYLAGLSDPEYQKKCWVDGICPTGIEHDEFDYAVHFLFDDTTLSSDAKSLIGVFLKDESEANLVQSVCEKIQAVFNKYGTNLSDQEYIDCPEWRGVVSAARNAYKTICAGEFAIDTNRFRGQ